MIYSQDDKDSLTSVISIPLEPLIRDYDNRTNYNQSFFSCFSCFSCCYWCFGSN